MTDHHSGYIVTLASDIREDDAKRVMDALRMFKGVLSVKPVPSDVTQHIADERANRRWQDALYDLARKGPADA